VLFVEPNEAFVRKLPHMTWFGHCIVNVTSALRALPSAGQLMLISDLRDFLDREEQKIRRREGERGHSGNDGAYVDIWGQ
jgi:hypothetical protein